jgi:hypothetical protein
MIPDFLEDRLGMRELDAFLRHTERCDACRDEMSTQYLVSRGLEILETDRIFDLRTELANPAFENLIKNNVNIQTAYEVIHKDEIITGAMAATAKQVEQKAESLQRSAHKTVSNPLGGQRVFMTDTEGNPALSNEFRDLARTCVNAVCATKNFRGLVKQIDKDLGIR